MAVPAEAPPARRDLWWRLALLVAAFAVWQVSRTYGVLSQTADEPLHVAAGLEWFELGTHRVKPENPPLAEIPVGVGAYLAGHELPPKGAPFVRGTELLYRDGAYLRNLTQARLGTLPFFGLAILLVWWWAKRAGSARAGALAAISFCTLPPVLGHAGLATTDVATAATFVLALWTYVRWLEAPTVARALGFGAAFGLALAAKFSVLVLFPPAAVAVLALRFVLRLRRPTPEAALAPRPRWRRWVLGGACAVLACCVVVWSVYRFSVGVLASPAVDRLLASCFPNADGLGRRVFAWLCRQPIPAPDCLLGLLLLWAHAAEGQWAYLFGEHRQFGFRLFYPVSLGVKTPLPFAALTVLALVPIARRLRAASWQALAPAVAAVTMVLTVIPSTINLGLRHVLAVYPLLAITVGIGLDALLRCTAGSCRRAAAASIALLLGWQAAIVVREHPNYLGYFNPLAGAEPGRILVDSDLDWGQDLLQLASFFQDREEVERLHIAYFGNVRLCEHGLPPLAWLEPGKPVTGWVAISEMYFRNHWRLTYADPCDRTRGELATDPAGYAWLAQHEPVAFAGRSIRIYHIPDRGRDD